MEKSKRSKPQVEDRLSELPDSLIFHILWFIPMSDVVRTTILSKRWSNLWTTTPFLNFDNDTKLINDTHIFRNFVNQVLFRWNGVRILKFKFDSCYHLDKSISTDLEMWMNFAKEKKVEELYLHLWDSENTDEICSVPQCLYSSSSLKLLSFDVCRFRMDGNVQWNHLQSLKITQGFGVTENMVNRILSGSPRLEALNLSFLDMGGNLNIGSNSLKELSICKYLYDLGNVCTFSELTIRTPNLETLEIKGFPYSSCRLIDVSSLTRATIGFYGLIYGEDDDCDFHGIELENGFSSFQDYIGDKFSQVLETIQHVESVALFYCCPKVLKATRMRCVHSSFRNVKCLKIGSFYDNYEQLVGLVENFTQLERLVLEDNEDEYCCQDSWEALDYDEGNICKSFVVQLRRIEISWIYGDSIFPLIETLLKYASKLEKMVFRVDNIISESCLLSASKKLLSMPRSSTNCSIHFLHN